MHVPEFHQIVSLTTTNNSNETLAIIIHNEITDVLKRSVFSTVLIAVCLSIIILLTILGNILVLIALCINFALRSPTHLLMGNLACADLLLGKPKLSLFVVLATQNTVPMTSLLTLKRKTTAP